MWVKINTWHSLRDELDYFEGATTRCGLDAEGKEPMDSVPMGDRVCSQCKKIEDKDQEPE